MIRKYRLILYAVVTLTIPVLSYLIYPELGMLEPLSFVGVCLVIFGGYEIYAWKAGKK